MKKMIKVLDDLERCHHLAVSARVRALQYSGTATGQRASDRSEHWEERFFSAAVALRDLIAKQEGA